MRPAFRTQTFALESTIEQLARFFQILWCVDAERHALYHHHIDTHAGVERAQLLQFLALLISRGWQFDETLQCCATIGIEPDMMIVRTCAGRVFASEDFCLKAVRRDL